MELEDAVALIAPAVAGIGRTWADFGAGRGTFTRALLRLLGSSATVYAIDRDRAALRAIDRWAKLESGRVIPIVDDFERAAPSAIGGTPLDGLLLANALHFSANAEAVLGRLATLLRPGGRAVIVEYDRRRASRWVPYPISPMRLRDIAAGAAMSPPTVVGRMPSAYAGEIYAAYVDRPVDGGR